MNEIIFLIQEAPEGGYRAHALGHSVFTQAETEEELRAKIQEVTASHFGPGRVAKIVTGFEHAPETKVNLTNRIDYAMHIDIMSDPSVLMAF